MRIRLPTLLLLATCAALLACGPGPSVQLCQPACAGIQCGADGCGGACGTCPSGATCTALGICHASAATPSPGCPLGGACTYLQRVAWSYDCISASDCARSGAIGTYGTFEACQTWGCMGGNSRCGDQFGNLSDPRRWSCEACKVSCHEGTPTACGVAHETAQGCALADSTWGGYWADCVCQ